MRSDQFWTNHFGTVGLVGVNEACLNLMGKSIGDDAGAQFAEKILNHMREKLIKAQEETGHLYNLEATPAEGTTYNLAMRDKAQFPNIICANEAAYQSGNDPFYTNSTPVSYTHLTLPTTPYV
jgi:ribonucleoside-triphosphate reductase